jgi:hypothetical protein
MLERPGRDHYSINLPSLQSQGSQSFDHRRREPSFHNAKYIGFRGRRLKAQSVADLFINGIHGLPAATLCHRKTGKMSHRIAHHRSQTYAL